jgi:hypothetical protein
MRLQLHALGYNLGNFLRTLATPEPIKDWSPTSLKEKLIKIGAKVVSHGRYVAFQMAEVAIPRQSSRRFCGLLQRCGLSRRPCLRGAADFQGSGQKGDGSFTGAPGIIPASTLTFTDELDWFGTVRGRVGYAFDRWLPYVTGGLGLWSRQHQRSRDRRRGRVWQHIQHL